MTAHPITEPRVTPICGEPLLCIQCAAFITADRNDAGEAFLRLLTSEEIGELADDTRNLFVRVRRDIERQRAAAPEPARNVVAVQFTCPMCEATFQQADGMGVAAGRRLMPLPGDVAQCGSCYAPLILEADPDNRPGVVGARLMTREEFGKQPEVMRRKMMENRAAALRGFLHDAIESLNRKGPPHG